MGKETYLIEMKDCTPRSSLIGQIFFLSVFLSENEVKSHWDGPDFFHVNVGFRGDESEAERMSFASVPVSGTIFSFCSLMGQDRSSP